jgi:predicted kinase
MSNSTPDNSTLTLVLMAGLSGVGKSTLARALKKELGWQVIDKDGLKEQLLRDGLDDYAAGYRAYDWSFEAVREELKHNRSVILDSAALHSFILEAAQKIVSDMIPVQVRLKVLFLVVADRERRRERIKQRPPQTTVIRVDPLTINDYLDCYSHLPLPPGSFYLDTSTKTPEDYQSRASYYLTSDDEKYNDDEEMLKMRYKIHVLSKVG